MKNPQNTPKIVWQPLRELTARDWIYGDGNPRRGNSSAPAASAAAAARNWNWWRCRSTSPSSRRPLLQRSRRWYPPILQHQRLRKLASQTWKLSGIRAALELFPSTRGTLRYASAGRPTSRGPVSVCLSQVIVLSKWVNEFSCFGMVASLYPSYTVLKGNSAISNNKYTSLWNFAPNSGLWKFCFGISIVETC